MATKWALAEGGGGRSGNTSTGTPDKEEKEKEEEVVEVEVEARRMRTTGGVQGKARRGAAEVYSTGGERVNDGKEDPPSCPFDTHLYLLTYSCRVQGRTLREFPI